MQAVGFRNLEPFDIGSDAAFVVVHGPNAQGKTNLLEAVYLLATLKPLRARRNSELVRFGQEDAVVAGSLKSTSMSQRYKLRLGKAGRQLELDGQKASQDAWFETIRAIAFTPNDAEIVLGGPTERRAWLDRAAFTKSPIHLAVVRRYRRCVQQKVAALKAGANDALLDTLDEQLALAGEQLVQRRLDLLEELQPRLRDLYGQIAGDVGEELALRYQSGSLANLSAPLVPQLMERFRRARSEERRRRSCLAGPHRDEVMVTIGGKPARAFGSRGQIRSVVLTMKLAELVAARDRGEVPLFLVDDLSSELDASRTARLVDILGELRAQVWISTTDPSLLERLPRDDARFFQVGKGVIS